MTAVLLDVNVLLALAWPNHQMHERAADSWPGSPPCRCHTYLTEPEPPASAAFGVLVGPKQVTDAWLVFVAQGHGSRLATFDRRIGSWAPIGSLELL
ncbi:MAG: hypothetical protein H0V89_11260 [Deltaproteobacteria bacterium]|nr:hypothetical protein [Deltaproteobacteria bacterium]